MYQSEMLQDGLIVSHYAGSHAYGTSTPESDVDIRGIFCTPLIYKVSPWLSCNEISVPEEEDTKYYEFVKFMSLVVDQNPNIVETLWVDKSSIIRSSEAYEHLVENAYNLLSSKVAFTYSGYAVSQLNRIKNHGKWINNPQPKEPPVQKNYIKMLQNFNNEKLLKFDVFKYEKDHFFVHYGNDVYGIYGGKGERLFDNAGCIINKFENNNHELGVPMFLVKYVKEEYKKDKETHKNYWTWVKNRNKVRSDLEQKYGYDCKHGSHLVRLLRTGEEILTEGVVRVMRPDAQELLDIRNGSMSYDELVSWAEAKDKEIRDVHYKNTSLRKKVDTKFANRLIVDVLEIMGMNNL